MTDALNGTPEGSGTETPPETTPGVTEAELSQMRNDSAELQRIKDEAANAGFDTIQDQIDFLEDEAVRLTTEERNNQPPPQAPDPSTRKAENIPPPPDNTEELKAELKQTRDMATAAMLQSNYGEYNQNQKGMAEESKDGFSRQDLDKALSGPFGKTIAGTVKEFGGNYYAAAAHHLNFNKSAATIRQQGAQSAEAIKKAEVSAEVEGGQPLVVEEAKSDNDVRADGIAPDDPALY